jgi:hypothetical protein
MKGFVEVVLDRVLLEETAKLSDPRPQDHLLVVRLPRAEVRALAAFGERFGLTAEQLAAKALSAFSGWLIEQQRAR